MRVKNDNVNLFRYFAATAQAVFLYTCVQETIEHALPDKVVYLQAYGRFSQVTQAILEMPNQKIDLLRHFLKQAIGHLSKHARMNLQSSRTPKLRGLRVSTPTASLNLPTRKQSCQLFVRRTTSEEICIIGKGCVLAH